MVQIPLRLAAHVRRPLRIATILTEMLTCGAGSAGGARQSTQIHLAQQRGETRVGAQWIPDRVRFQN
jgi:hypothetical protein